MPIKPVTTVYLEMVLLPESCRPCSVRRSGSRTLIWVDPRATRDQAIRWAERHLSPVEWQTLSATYGDLNGFRGDDQPVIADVPPVLQVPRVVQSA